MELFNQGLGVVFYDSSYKNDCSDFIEFEFQPEKYLHISLPNRVKGDEVNESWYTTFIVSIVDESSDDDIVYLEDDKGLQDYGYDTARKLVWYYLNANTFKLVKHTESFDGIEFTEDDKEVYQLINLDGVDTIGDLISMEDAIRYTKGHHLIIS